MFGSPTFSQLVLKKNDRSSNQDPFQFQGLGGARNSSSPFSFSNPRSESKSALHFASTTIDVSTVVDAPENYLSQHKQKISDLLNTYNCYLEICFFCYQYLLQQHQLNRQ